MIWVILLTRYAIVWLGFMSVVIFVVYCIYFFISKPVPVLMGKLSHRAEDGVRVSRVMRLSFLGYASIRWIWC